MSNPSIKCFAHYHMTAPEYALWDVCRSLSHQSGILYFNGRGIAARFESMAKSTAYNLAESLVEKGWFQLLKDSQRRKDGQFSPRQYKVLSHADWAAENPGRCDSPVQLQDSDESSPVQPHYSPVQLQNQPVQPEGHNLISTTDTNLPSNQPDYLIACPTVGLDGFVQRYSKKRGRQRKSAAAPIRTGEPVPDSGQAVRDTQVEAERLSVAVTNTLGLTKPEAKSEWCAGIKAILDRGHTPEVVSDVIAFGHSRLKPGTMQREGAAGFVGFFDQMHEGWRNSLAKQEGIRA
jgi:hypothetical protein